MGADLTKCTKGVRLASEIHTYGVHFGRHGNTSHKCSEHSERDKPINPAKLRTIVQPTT